MKLDYFLLFIIGIFSLTYGQSVVPLTTGNKWIFDVIEISQAYYNREIDTSKYIKIYEVVSDTIVSPDFGIYVKCYKVKVTLNSNISYEYWGSDTNRFYIWPDYGHSFNSFADKYYAQIKKDTSWQYDSDDSYKEYIKIYDMDFLKILNRRVQETRSFHATSHFFWTSYYITALNFGIVKIKLLLETGIYEDTTIATIKGALINGIPYGDTIITSVNIQNSLYNFYKLSQNYPNPFNPSTKIEYSIPRASFVILKVYDILGREVATLVNEEKNVGNYEINFNNRNLSSGIYFYKLQAGDYSSVKKMILIK